MSGPDATGPAAPDRSVTIRTVRMLLDDMNLVVMRMDSGANALTMLTNNIPDRGNDPDDEAAAIAWIAEKIKEDALELARQWQAAFEAAQVAASPD